METEWDYRRKRLFEIIEIGLPGDVASQVYDAFNILSIVINLVVSVMNTFDDLHARFGPWLVTIEAVTVAFFAADFAMRLWTAKFLRPSLTEPRAVLRYIFSFSGLVDLLSFLPYYLPVFFPSGAVAFRMFRVARVFRLFRVNAYYDSLGVITQVISSKRQQLFSSVFILLVLMLASSLCMYSLEHDAQPEVFSNAFSGIWWSVSTLLTIGYGDIYPVTTMGKIFSIFITFLGVGMVAIPTGIISAGFVDQYTRIKRISEYADEDEVHFIRVALTEHDSWSGKTIQQLGLPHGVIVVAIQRGHEVVVPRGSVKLMDNDVLVLGAESVGSSDQHHIELKELELRQHNPWNGQRIRDLDISRQTLIVIVKRKGRMLIPNGDLTLHQGDRVILYTRTRMAHASSIWL
ncbi:ion transporter [Flintibacter faecis]|uniref:Ion transporter n=1 Tax=Flintibacter faecis TaxID=2763047 RepID=A0A8J6M4W5_9FIRM|nr:ion transporter [Flintibacter faecis]MBC5717783.1 ion transporter [Flintibacter faecis]